MKHKLFGYMTALAALMVVALCMGLLVLGRLNSPKEDMAKALNLQLKVFRDDMESMWKNNATLAEHLSGDMTVMLENCLEQRDVPVRVQTAIEMDRIAEPYIRSKAIRHLEKGRVVVFGCGTGNPFFSTDTGAALRAVEIGADAILLAKNIDGVYSADPAKDPAAVKYDKITYDEVLKQHLAVMDSTATSLSMDNHMPIVVFALKDPENIRRVVMGEQIGTTVKEEF